MLNITNFKDHPTEKAYVVFHFSDHNRADFFEQGILGKNLFFEKHVDEEDKRIYFAVNKTDFRKATAVNDESRVKFRKPFIPDKSLRYFVLTLFFIMAVLTIGGIISEQMNK
jgi:hypothetical protein